MARCTHCGKFIFRGIKEGSRRFCGESCYENGFLLPLSQHAGSEAIEKHIREVHRQRCPICHGQGPCDIVASHTAFSWVIFTHWRHKSQLSCAQCGKKEIWKSAIFTALFGWWGFPFGLIVTPAQLIKNGIELTRLPSENEPSEALQHMVKLKIGRALLDAAKSRAEYRRSA